MQTDGLTPIAFGDKDGWPAMGTFDILNLRLNGYDFHTELLAGEQKWTDPKVTDGLPAVGQDDPVPGQGLRRPDLAAGGRHARPEEVRDVPARPVRLVAVRGHEQARRHRRLDFFPFPNLGTAFDAEKALDAPIDTWQLSAKSPNLATETDTGKAYLEFWAKGSTQLLMFKGQPGLIPTASDTDTSSYSDLQKKAVEVVSAAQRHHPVPRSRYPLRLRRRERHAELPADVPGGPGAGPAEVPGEHPGVLGRPAAPLVNTRWYHAVRDARLTRCQ